MRNPSFSIICCYYNEINILQKKFYKFFEFSSKLDFDYKFIFIDNNSSDGTKEFLKKEEQKKRENFFLYLMIKTLEKEAQLKKVSQ